MSQETPSKPTDLSDKHQGRIDFAAKTAEVFEKTRAEGADIETRLAAVGGFLDQVEAAAKAGAIKSSAGEVYSAETIRDQLQAMEGIFNGREKLDGIDDPLVLLPRAGGLRQAVNALLTDETTAAVLLHEIGERARQSDRAAEIEPKQASIQQELGREAVEASGVVEKPELITGIPDHIMNPKPVVAEKPEQPKSTAEALPVDDKVELDRIEKALDEIMDGLSEEDKVAVWQYGTALYGHEMESAMRKMSRATRESGAAGRYAELYARYKKISGK